MTVVAVIFFPLVLLYQGWSFHVFRARLQAPAKSSTVEPPLTPPEPPAGPGPATPQVG